MHLKFTSNNFIFGFSFGISFSFLAYCKYWLPIYFASTFARGFFISGISNFYSTIIFSSFSSAIFFRLYGFWSFSSISCFFLYYRIIFSSFCFYLIMAFQSSPSIAFLYACVYLILPSCCMTFSYYINNLSSFSLSFL